MDSPHEQPYSILKAGLPNSTTFCRMSQAWFDVTAQVKVRVEFKHGPMVENFKDSKKQNKIEKTFFETLEMTFCLLRKGYHTCILTVQRIEYLHASTVQEHLSSFWCEWLKWCRSSLSRLHSAAN